MSEILLSQLAHVELISPKPDKTVEWMKEVFGLEETTREGQSVYLRGWAEWLHSSLIVTEGPEPGVGRIGWRTYGPEDPEIVAKRLAGTEEAVGWVDAWTGHGATYRYRAPHGRHLHEVFWDVERYQAPPEKRDPVLENRPQRFSGRGIGARYLDHVTMPTRNMRGDIDFYRRLGARHTAQTEVEPGFEVFSTLTCNGIRSTHDLALVPDFSGMTGRAHHVAFRVDQRQDVERAAEIFLANDTPIEFGPGIHGIDEITYLYVREPGGFRMEINAGGWVNTMPDWETTTYQAADGNPGQNLWRNVDAPDGFHDAWPLPAGQAADRQHAAVTDERMRGFFGDQAGGPR
ncbi:VOC family protein [Amycolatopsis jiangsuensis]|uniref:Catechol 2,3-dioxygenase n=1 Tax=Amycolatopsis jiangsuensis TaxID=1181879 RepID=A0A840IPP6_9PSEU|nr:VOC family protein [Amycolatopsis jiangsuensis]MBB4683148.1 catechol 2,3-dioxygenase [Amycolatopsis jiangsuensis]